MIFRHTIFFLALICCVWNNQVLCQNGIRNLIHKDIGKNENYSQKSIDEDLSSFEMVFYYLVNKEDFFGEDINNYLTYIQENIQIEGLSIRHVILLYIEDGNKSSKFQNIGITQNAYLVFTQNEEIKMMIEDKIDQRKTNFKPCDHIIEETQICSDKPLEKLKVKYAPTFKEIQRRYMESKLLLASMKQNKGIKSSVDELSGRVTGIEKALKTVSDRQEAGQISERAYVLSLNNGMTGSFGDIKTLKVNVEEWRYSEFSLSYELSIRTKDRIRHFIGLGIGVSNLSAVVSLKDYMETVQVLDSDGEIYERTSTFMNLKELLRVNGAVIPLRYGLSYSTKSDRLSFGGILGIRANRIFSADANFIEGQITYSGKYEGMTEEITNLPELQLASNVHVNRTTSGLNLRNQFISTNGGLFVEARLFPKVFFRGEAIANLVPKLNYSTEAYDYQSYADGEMNSLFGQMTRIAYNPFFLGISIVVRQ